jgi:hypothetical protein
MASDNEDEKIRREAFVRHLEQASETVRSWPHWKQTILGAPRSDAPSSQPRLVDPLQPGKRNG